MNEVEKAVEILNKGGIIIFPTETVYGIGCLLSHPKSIKKLYSLKKRDPSQPTSVLCSSLEQTKEFVYFNQMAERLAKELWPGPLTICLPAKENVPEEVLGAGGTLGIRAPGKSWVSDLLLKLNAPILAPSANFKGEKPPTKFAEIDKNLAHLVDYVVAREPGGQKPSTVVVFEGKDNYKITREGDITTKVVEATLEKED